MLSDEFEFTLSEVDNVVADFELGNFTDENGITVDESGNAMGCCCWLFSLTSEGDNVEDNGEVPLFSSLTLGLKV